MAARVSVIAEAGVNHNGSLDLAIELVEAAARSGADVVKFQTFRASHVASRFAGKAAYQALTTSGAESQLDMIRALELSEDDHRALIKRATKCGISFLSTPFDVPSLRLLVDGFDLQTIKIPSGEITNAPFLLACAREGRRIILSTGMSTLGEVEAALGVLAFGLIGRPDQEIGDGAFLNAYASDAGQMALRDKVTLLHCTSEYPAPIETINLRAMDTLANAFGLPVGLSDHSAGINVAIAAAARNACLIEKHYTLDRTLPGPDHSASLEPQELAAMVAGIRDVERALGDGLKRPAEAELRNSAVVRRSLVASRPIRRGELFSTDNVAAKRPGGGLSPIKYWQLLGRPAGRDYAPDEPVDL